MSAPPPELVIFDCDGVLIDSEVLSARALVDEVARIGAAITPEFVRENVLGLSFPAVARVISQTLSVDLPDDFEARYIANLMTRFERELRPTPGVVDILSALRVPGCVATSSSPQRAARSLRISGLDTYFEGRVYTASQVKRGKPAPDLFLFAAQTMGFRPEQALVIEDSPAGIAAARAAGMAVLHYTGGQHLRGRTTIVDPDLRAFADWATLPELVPGLCGEGSKV